PRLQPARADDQRGTRTPARERSAGVRSLRGRRVEPTAAGLPGRAVLPAAGALGAPARVAAAAVAVVAGDTVVAALGAAERARVRRAHAGAGGRSEEAARTRVRGRAAD